MNGRSATPSASLDAAPAARAAAPATVDPVRQFLQDIWDTPVLTAEQEVELAQTLRAARTGLVDALARLPLAADRLIAAWRELREAGRVTGPLSERYEPGPAFAGQVDATLERLARATREARDRGRDAAARRRAAARAAEAYRQLDPRTDLLLEALADAEETLAGGRRDAARHLGLPRRSAAALVAEARQQRERYLETRNTFVRHNLRLVVHMAKDFRHMSVPFADLVQEGNLGLVRAVEKFDDTRGFRFSTYAAWWIYQAFIRGVHRLSRTVRLPSHVYDRMIQLRRLEEGFERDHGREPTAEDVAELMQLSLDDAAELVRARQSTVTLEGGGGDDDEVRPLLQRLSDEDVPDPVEVLDTESLGPRVDRLLGLLDSRERYIVASRFGLGQDEARTLQELADELGLSRERVRQIEKRALARMGEEAHSEGLASYLH